MEELSYLIYLIIGYVLMLGYRVIFKDDEPQDTTEYLIINFLIFILWPIFILFHVVLAVCYILFAKLPRALGKTYHEKKPK